MRRFGFIQSGLLLAGWLAVVFPFLSTSFSVLAPEPSLATAAPDTDDDSGSSPVPVGEILYAAPSFRGEIRVGMTGRSCRAAAIPAGRQLPPAISPATPLARTWQFSLRTALPPRAPDFRS